ncbi:hypothetical protein MSAN_00543600 [Mycena sanguinolenta]|uniref:Uncharacterized protein n=1 Tax=Mycena sanguinolenta TaxID=230812 RepID=A0A8H6ZCU5_9AGAR|nr:hypothetical protein MSAN_00543600 [Mycena sanguinolenta]
MPAALIPTSGDTPMPMTSATFLALTQRAQNLKAIIMLENNQLVQLTQPGAQLTQLRNVMVIVRILTNLKKRKENYSRVVNILDRAQIQDSFNGDE